MSNSEIKNLKVKPEIRKNLEAYYSALLDARSNAELRGGKYIKIDKDIDYSKLGLMKARLMLIACLAQTDGIPMKIREIDEDSLLSWGNRPENINKFDINTPREKVPKGPSKPIARH